MCCSIHCFHFPILLSIRIFANTRLLPFPTKSEVLFYSKGKQQAQLPRICVTKVLPAVRCQVNHSSSSLPHSSHPHNANNSQYLPQVPQRLGRFIGDCLQAPRTKLLLHHTVAFWLIRRLCCTAVSSISSTCFNTILMQKVPNLLLFHGIASVAAIPQLQRAIWLAAVHGKEGTKILSVYETAAFSNASLKGQST